MKPGQSPHETDRVAHAPAAAIGEGCIVCGCAEFHDCFQSAELMAVTSDCKPWPQGGLIRVCFRCGHVQKAMDEQWRSAARRIYGKYDLYHQSGGVEQVLFGADPRGALTRSTQLLDRLQTRSRLPRRGRMLDVGCGNGAMLRSFAAMFPDWLLTGAEQNDRYRDEVSLIPGVQRFHSGSLGSLDETFDLIAVVHVLEHVPQPVQFLRQLASKLAPGGKLLIQVPDLSKNPFDLLVMDHSSHFVQETLVALARTTGYAVQEQAADWVSKELTLVLSASPTTSQFESAANAQSIAVVDGSLAWLGLLVAQAHNLAAASHFGIFGTAIAGTWLGGVLRESVDFFVDEDQHRAGRPHLQRTVLLPAQVPAGSCVYLALPPELAYSVNTRLSAISNRVQYMLPPAFTKHSDGTELLTR